MAPQQQQQQIFSAVVKNTFIDLVDEKQSKENQRTRAYTVACDGKSYEKETSEPLFTITFNDPEPESEPYVSGLTTPEVFTPMMQPQEQQPVQQTLQQPVQQQQQQQQQLSPLSQASFFCDTSSGTPIWYAVMPMQPPMQAPQQPLGMQRQQQQHQQEQRVPIQLHQSLTQHFQQQEHSQQHQQQQKEQIPEHERTTLMLRNIPNDYTFPMLKELLDSFGFCGHYDFLYLPMDFRKGANIGYAFVNGVDPAAARRIREAFDGFESWAIQSGKTCEVSWSYPQQGLAEHVERYRNSPVMHESTPLDYKPRIYQRNGYEVPFPSPTKPLKPVKLRPMRQNSPPRC